MLSTSRNAIHSLVLRRNRLNMSKLSNCLASCDSISDTYHHNAQRVSISLFSTGNEKLKDTIDKIKQSHSSMDGNDVSSNDSAPKHTNTKSQFSSDAISSSISYVSDNIRLAFLELFGYNTQSSLRRQVMQASSFKKPGQAPDDDTEYTGPKEIVAVKEPLNPWDQMKARLQNSPLIRTIMTGSKQLGKVAANTEIGKKAKEINDHVKDKIEDIREIWETSQNPVIYTLSGVWENITGESEEAIATTAIRRLDPNFVKEIWAEDVRNNLAGPVIKAHLAGSLKGWREWLGEAVYEKLSADIRARKVDGYSFDPNILGLDDNMIIVRLLDNGTPVIVVVYMVQQINCIRNREGEIIEGGESDLRAKFYSIAFQQDYNDETGVFSWKIVDYEFAGDVPYVF